jgi:hypothetical protein
MVKDGPNVLEMVAVVVVNIVYNRKYMHLL